MTNPTAHVGLRDNPAIVPQVQRAQVRCLPVRTVSAYDLLLATAPLWAVLIGIALVHVGVL